MTLQNFVQLAMMLVLLGAVALVVIYYWRHPRWLAFWRLLAAVFGLGVVFALLPLLINLSPSQASRFGTSTPAGGINPTPQPTPTPVAFVNLVIAVQELPRGYRIPPNALALRRWPEYSAPFNGVTNIEDVVGKIARTDIFREQPILSNMVVEDYNDLAQVNTQPEISLNPRGVADFDTTLTGEINGVNWADEWRFAGEGGQTVTLMMRRSAGDLKPFLIVWDESSLEWVEGLRVLEDDHTTLTITLPNSAIYIVNATRARLNNGATRGSYELILTNGYPQD